MSFRTRLVLAAAYLVAAVVLALEIPLALSIERRFWPRASPTTWRP